MARSNIQPDDYESSSDFSWSSLSEDSRPPAPKWLRSAAAFQNANKKEREFLLQIYARLKQEPIDTVSTRLQHFQSLRATQTYRTAHIFEREHMRSRLKLWPVDETFEPTEKSSMDRLNGLQENSELGELTGKQMRSTSSRTEMTSTTLSNQPRSSHRLELQKKQQGTGTNTSIMAKGKQSHDKRPCPPPRPKNLELHRRDSNASKERQLSDAVIASTKNAPLSTSKMSLDQARNSKAEHTSRLQTTRG